MRPMAAVLRAFMEESNIRWGEIVSGLLIVVCAIGLVISLWSTLRDTIPYLPALIFMLGTGAFHAAGHYTLRQWKLQSISRAVLIIATLLIPLNLLAAIALSGTGEQRTSMTDPSYIAAVTICLAAYTAMSFFAGRALTGASAWLWTLGVIGPSAGQLVINRAYKPDASTAGLMFLAALPLASYVVATGGVLWRARAWQRVSPRRAQPLFLVLGIASFAIAAALGLLISKGESIGGMLAELSPALSILSAVILVHGLFIHARTSSKRLATLRTAGTSLAIGGAFGLLVTLVLAWPQPHLLVSVAVVNVLVLLGGAMAANLPVLHIGAVACGALASVVAYHLVRDHFGEDVAMTSRRLIETLRSGETAAVLAVFGELVALAAIGLKRLGRKADARSFAWSRYGVAGLSAATALAIGYLGGEARWLAAPLLGAYAAALLGVSFWKPDERLSIGGAVLLLAAIVQALWLNDPVRAALNGVGLLPLRPVLVATLAHALICAALAALAGRRRAWQQDVGGDTRWQDFVVPVAATGLVSTFMTLPWILRVPGARYADHACYAIAAAAVWCIAALVQRSPAARSVFQAFASLALGFATTAFCQRRSWWEAEWFDLRHVEWQLGVLGVWCLIWPWLRMAVARWPRVHDLLGERRITFDKVLLGGLIVLLLIAAICGAAPGTLNELGFSKLAASATLTERAVAYQLGGWLAWAIVAAATASLVRERATPDGLAGLLVCGVAAVLMIVGPFEATIATASALRWLLAGFGSLAAVAVCSREPINAAAERIGWGTVESPRAASVLAFKWLVLVFTAVPVLLFTTLTVVQVAASQPLGGPLAESVFARMGPTWSFSVPLGLVTAALLAFAARDSQPGFALAGSFCFQFLASLACLLPALTSGQPFDEAAWLLLLQWNAMALGVYALVWLALRQRIEGNARPLLSVGETVVTQIVFAVTATALVAVIAAVGVTHAPGSVGRQFSQLGEWRSYVALACAAAAIGWRCRGRFEEVLPHMIGGGGLCLAAFVAASGGSFTTAANWLSFHILSAGCVVVAAASVAGAWSPRHAREAWVGWMIGAGAMVAPLALRGAANDPLTMWWSPVSTWVIAALAIAVGLRLRRQFFAYASTMLVGAGLIWLEVGPGRATGSVEVWRLLQCQVLAVGVMSGFWLATELHYQRRHLEPLQPDFRFVTAHRFFAMVAIFALSLLVCLGFTVATFVRAGNRVAEADVSNLWGVLALVTVGVLLFAALWDRMSRFAVPAIYLWGLLAVVVVIDAFSVKLGRAFFAVGVAAAVYVALTGTLWRRGANLAAWGLRMGISDPVAALRRTNQWLPVTSAMLTLASAFVGLIVVLGFDDRALRIIAGFTPAVAALGVGSLAQAERRGLLQYLSLMMTVMAGVYLGWADIQPAWTGEVWLSRVIRLLVALCGAAFLYAVVIGRRLEAESEWLLAVRRTALTAAASGLAVLAIILLLEVGLFIEDPATGAPVTDIQLAAVAVVMVVMVAALIALAVLPGRDPLAMSEEGRMLYVYAAQAAAALLFAHIFLARPQWFSEELRQYWPYIVIGIAFAGAGVGELLQRAGVRVLADPLQRTGGFLPLLPAIGMWIVASNSDYSMLLFSAGLVYVFLTISRQSPVSAIAAAVAGNGALWALLSEQGSVIWQQPQLWMIPPAASVLIAAEINRSRLSESVLTGWRYGCMLVIYVSSTGEMFLHGIGEHLWPPMLLLGLSVAGALVGIAFRIRAFLFLGSTFAFLSVVSMVWHASKSIEHSWPWWAFGIGLGLAILIMFGIFEKQRDAMTKMVDGMRQWDR